MDNYWTDADTLIELRIVLRLSPSRLQFVAPYIGVPRHASSPSTFSAAFIFAVSDCFRLFVLTVVCLF